ncbi:unnamed protein product [Urochloa humidicola]
MASSDLMNMNSRAYLFQLQVAEAAVPPVHAADDDEPVPLPPTPKSLLRECVGELEAQQGASDTFPAPPQQGSGGGVAPMGVGIVMEPTKCPECPKWFVSEKAMFGHLRKHPDRGYKGATRPATTAAAAALAGETKMPKKKQLVARNEADVSAMNLMAAAATAGEKKKKKKKKQPWEEAAAAAELSTKWPVTARRGRAPPFFAAGAAGKQQQQQASGGDDEEDEEAAMILLGMASSSNSTTSETQQAPAAGVHAPDAASGHPMPDAEQQPMLVDHHVSMDKDNLTVMGAEQIAPPAGIVLLELSAESQTPPPLAVKEITTVEVATEIIHQVVVVPAANKPVVVAPGSGSGSGGGAKQKAKKQRRAGVVYLEQAVTAAAATEGADGDDGSRPAVWRIPSPASNKRHVCPTCGKWFSTYQALGGHMSSHVKAKSGAAEAHDELAAAQARHNIALAHRSLSGGGLVLSAAGAEAEALGQGLHLQGVHKPAAPHVCADCHMTFPSGQALGGHKRKHWFPEKHQAKAAAPAAEPAAPEPEPAPAAVPVPRDFDLNELPKEGEGESDQP